RMKARICFVRDGGSFPSTGVVVNWRTRALISLPPKIPAEAELAGGPPEAHALRIARRVPEARLAQLLGPRRRAHDGGGLAVGVEAVDGEAAGEAQTLVPHGDLDVPLPSGRVVVEVVADVVPGHVGDLAAALLLLREVLAGRRLGEILEDVGERAE